MALGLTLKEMSNRNLPGGEGRPACKVDNLTAIYEPIVPRIWEPRRLTTFSFVVIASSPCSSRNKEEMQKSRTQGNDCECPR
jgi:hypothetical protein